MKFYRHDNLEVKLGPLPGKGICLTIHVDESIALFTEGQIETLALIPEWVVCNCMAMDWPLHKMVKAAHPFVQSQTKDFMMIEFWTKDKQAIRDFCLLLMGLFDFVVDFTALLEEKS